MSSRCSLLDNCFAGDPIAQPKFHPGIIMV